MKDYIQKNGKDVSIVIYDAPLPPKYFKLTKRFIRTLFVIVPIFFVTLLFGLFIWGLGTRIKNSPVPSLPSIVSESESKISALETELKSIQQINNELSDKLSQMPSGSTSEDPYLMAIKKPYGMQNLLSDNKVALGQFELVQDTNKVNLKFQIISSIPDTKVMGHVLVFMISDSGLLAYPKESNLLLAEGVKYSSGEPFAVSRLRPTNAEFITRPTGDTVKFLIYIFSREGDLLLIKETEKFKVGAK